MQLFAWHLICKVKIIFSCFCEILLTCTERKVGNKKLGENCLTVTEC